MKVPAFIIYLLRIIFAKKAVFREPSRTDDEWVSVACAAYENCLHTYDQLINICGQYPKKAYDDEDLCYIPIAKQYLKLVDKKEKRNRLLRKCYITGNVDKVDDKQEIEDRLVGKRKRSSCRQKIVELELYIEKFSFLSDDNKEMRKQLSSEKCRIASKRFKDKCRKIQSCCSRVKDCRRKVNKHPIVEAMKTIEGKIKEERRECRETGQT